MTPRNSALAPVHTPGPVQVIAVTGGKGGVGKTAIAVNLATALSQRGRRVLLLDGDLGLANVDVLLGLSPKYTLEHVLSGDRQLEEVMVETATGLKVIPAASGVARMASLCANEHAAIVRAFSSLPGRFDTLVVDTAPGIHDSVTRFGAAAQHVLVTLRDEPASLTDAYALIKILSREHGVTHFRVVVNLSRSREQSQELFTRLLRVTERYLDVTLEYVGDVPEDTSLQKAVRKQCTVMEAYPGSESAKALKKLAVMADGWPMPEGPSGRIEFFLERLLARREPQLRVVK